jgi:addiction module HigA family antidote
MRAIMTQMYNPPHPGEVLKDTVLSPDGGGQTVTGFAEHLGVSRVMLSNIVNGRAAITPEMADRLEQALGTSAETWLRMQAAYDLWQVRHQKGRRKIRPLEQRIAA